MAATKPAECTEIVPVSTAIAQTQQPSTAQIDEEDAIPRPEVEVVTDEEKRHEEQTRKKAAPPAAFFSTATQRESPQFPGAEVSSATLLGFLAAAERVVPSGKTHPALSSVKMTYQPGDKARFYIEAAGDDLWAVVAMDATGHADTGFTAMVPLRHAKNAINALRLNYQSVMIGLNEDKVCLGPNMVPYGGKVEDFPAQPVVRDCDARAAMPAFYFEEICTRVIPACCRSTDPTEDGLRGVVLDFEYIEHDGQVRILCTAVATDGGRMHVLRLPRVLVEPKAADILPPAITVPDGFFRYLRAVANREWTAVEIGEEQISGRGEDYLAIASATMRGKATRKGITNWRAVDVHYESHWAVDRKELERVARAAADTSSEGSIRLRIDSLRNQLELCARGEDGQKFKETVGARRFGGPPVVDVKINGRYLLQAVNACRSGLLRFGFAEDLGDQAVSAIVIRGEDEQFKAVVMPTS